MKTPVTLASRARSIPVEARAEVLHLLRQIAHDLSAPVSTLAMEAHSARLQFAKLESSIRPGANPSTSEALATLEDICDNLERASASMQEQLAVLWSLESGDSFKQPALTSTTTDQRPGTEEGG